MTCRALPTIKLYLTGEVIAVVLSSGVEVNFFFKSNAKMLVESHAAIDENLVCSRLSGRTVPSSAVSQVLRGKLKRGHLKNVVRIFFSWAAKGFRSYFLFIFMKLLPEPPGRSASGSFLPYSGQGSAKLPPALLDNDSIFFSSKQILL